MTTPLVNVNITELAELSGKNAEQIETALLKLPQVDCPVIHRFSPGLNIRELFMPKGTIAIGHHQNFEHFNVMLKGKVLMLNDDGTKTELTAPQSFTGKAGRKVGYVMEDVVWQNIYPTTETNIDILENTYLTKSDTFKLNQTLKFGVDEIEREADRLDYQKMLKDVGVSHELALAQSENTEDVLELKLETLKVKLGKSPIQGTGLFATSYINEDEIISLARIEGMRTQAGRYTNHSVSPNAKMIKDADDNVFLVAIRNINGCMGGELGEEITVDYRQVIEEMAKEVLCQQ